MDLFWSLLVLGTLAVIRNNEKRNIDATKGLAEFCCFDFLRIDIHDLLYECLQFGVCIRNRVGKAHTLIFGSEIVLKL